jgi:signal transduction histidine kinase
VSRLPAFLRRHSFDLAIVLTAAAAALDVAYRVDELPAPRTPLWFAVPAAALVVLPLLGRRRWRFWAPATVWLLAVAVAFLDGRLLPSTAGSTAAGLAASFLLGQVPDARRARVGLALAVGGALIVIDRDPNHAAADLLFVPLPFAIAWLAGLALGERTTRAETAEERVRQAEREREATARIAVAEERIRIARELHDIVAHAVSVIVLQVGAVRHNLPETLGQEREVLQGVEQTGRTALVEMRRLLGALRRDDEDLALAPQPGLANLEPLLDEVRRAGLDVRLQIEGAPAALPSTLDLSAYRVVQEGLTNALKHAHARHADVVVRYGRDRLSIDVRDDGDGGRPGDGRGQGLVGVGERVKIYGGEMSAGAGAAGGFLLSTRFPLDRRHG